MKRSLPGKALNAVFGRVNRKRQWHELPFPVNLLNLLSLRLDLRDMNLFDTGEQIRTEATQKPPKHALRARLAGGRWNDLKDPEMGSTNSSFTRNINPKRIKPTRPPRLHDPSARKVSLELMTRDEFKPATNLNILAAAWIQFENHNWFFHGRGREDEVMDVPIEDHDDWHEHPMHVRRTVSPADSQDGRSSGDSSSIDFGNTESHWWDGSQIYGADQETQNAVRTFEDGKLKIGANGRLLEDPDEA